MYVRGGSRGRRLPKWHTHPNEVTNIDPYHDVAPSSVPSPDPFFPGYCLTTTHSSPTSLPLWSTVQIRGGKEVRSEDFTRFGTMELELGGGDNTW